MSMTQNERQKVLLCRTSLAQPPPAVKLSPLSDCLQIVDTHIASITGNPLWHTIICPLSSKSISLATSGLLPPYVVCTEQMIFYSSNIVLR